jgi:hypothetical protein
VCKIGQKLPDRGVIKMGDELDLHDEVMQYALDVWKEEYEHIYNEPDVKFHSYDTNQITLIAGQNEMLRITDDGFYVRGIRVEADDNEAKRVYNAFKEFLVWAALNRK